MSTSNSFQNEKIIFKCDRHAANISEKLMSFYEENEFFDISLIAGNDCIVIEAHRIVLSALSEYFLETFRGQAASKNNVVELKEIKAPTLKLIIDFMYSGWIELSLETVESLLRAAAFLRMKELVDACSKFIETRIISTNCLNWLRLAKELNLSGLKEKSLICTYCHFEDLSKEKQIMLLNEEELKDLLFTDNPHGDFEEHIFLCMVAWIEYDKMNREDVAFNLLSMVRYQYLTPKFIVENRKSVCKTVESYELICTWLQWHLSPETRSVDQQICVLKPRKGELAAISCSDSYKVKIQTYNPKVDSWSTKEALLSNKKDSYSMIVIHKNLIVVGGRINDITTNRVTTNKVECLDMSTFKSTNLPPMQEARYRCQLANVNGHLCVFGGVGQKKEKLTSLEIFDFSTLKWNYVEPPSKPNQESRIVAHNGILYIFDYINGCLQCYDVSSNQWKSKELVKNLLRAFSIAAVDRYLYVIGGILSNHYVNTVRRFDLYNNTWCQVSPLPKYRAYLNTSVFGNKIMICGGSPEINKILVEEYNLHTGKWTTLSSELNVDCFSSVLCTLPIEL